MYDDVALSAVRFTMFDRMRICHSKSLGLIWAFFICKGVFYAVLFPMWEGFDEFAHFAFIEHIALHHRLTMPDTRVSREIDRSLELVSLPWLFPKNLSSYRDHDSYWHSSAQERSTREAEVLKIPQSAQSEPGQNYLYEGKQAPLYYSMMAPVFILTRWATLPSRVFIFRVINVLLASALVPIAFVLSRRMFVSEATALGVCLLIVSMPELYIDVARVGNQVLAMILFSLLTYLCFTIVEGRAERLPAAGIVAGLLLLTKAYGLAALPVLIGCGVFAALQAPVERRRRVMMLSAAAVLCTAGIAGWWYLRNIELVGAVIWIDGAPEQKMSTLQILGTIPKMSWSTMLNSLVGSHIWFGGWSFLSVRSWIYRVFECGTIVVGGITLVLLKIRSKSSAFIKPAGLAVCIGTYGAFVASIAYHALMNFINSGVPASAGWYLYAVVLPEAILIVAGLLVFRWGKQLMAVAVGFFFALELYATHFLMIPYYSGLISHVPNGGLRSFHLSQLAGIPLTELVSRLTVNRPPFIGQITMVILWGLYIAASTAVLCLAVRWSALGSAEIASSERPIRP